MKISTKEFKENRNLISYLRDSNSEISEGLYLDFANKKVCIKNTVSKFFATFNFNYELSVNESIPSNFLIDSEKFMAIISQTDEIEFEDSTFKYLKNEFKIRTNSEIEFPANELPTEYSSSFKVTPKIVALLIKATGMFYPEKIEDRFSTAYIQSTETGTYLYSINQFRGYMVKLDDTDTIKLDFHSTFIDLIKCIDSKSFTLYYDESIGTRRLVTESGLEIYSPVYRCTVPDFGKKIFEFVNKPNCTVAIRDNLISTLNSMKPMYSNIDLDKKISITTCDKEIILELKDSVNPYIKLVTDCVSSTDNTTKIVDFENFSKLIKLIDGENIELKLSDDSPVCIVKSLVPEIFEIAILSIPKSVKA